MKVGVIGAGSLGTALAQIIAQNVDEVLLMLRKEHLADIPLIIIMLILNITRIQN